MFLDDEWFSGRQESSSAWLDVERLEPRTRRLRQFGVLLAGMLGLWAAHQGAQLPTDPSTTRVLLWCVAGTGIALWMIANAVVSFFGSIANGQDRIFRARHVLGCGLVQFAAAAVVSFSLVDRDPFSRLLAHGKITGLDIVDLGYAAAAGLCLFGAIAALVVACEAYRRERHWHRYV